MTKLLAYMPTPGGLTGAPRRLLTLAAALREHDVLVCVATCADSELIQVARAEDYKTVPVDAAGVLGLRQGALFGGGVLFRLRVLADLLRQNWRLFRCIRKQQVNAVWIRGSKGIAFGGIGAVLGRRPLLWDIDYELPSKGLIHWLHRFGLWAANAVICQYHAAPHEIFGDRLATLYQRKFHTITPGINLTDVEVFRDKRKYRSRADDAPFVILQVGTICERKNQAVIIEALSQAMEHGSGTDWELWLAYDEIQLAGFENALIEHGLENNVRLLGWRDDVKDLMVKADILVMPSKAEGVPNAVQEAMAIGLPVLVSQAGGMPEIVKEGGTGWIIDMHDTSEWARRILWCARHQPATTAVGEAASAYAFEHFGTEGWGREYARIVRAVIPGSASPGRH